MADDPPLQLKPRLTISIEQAQAIVSSIAPHATVSDVIELRGGEISTILEIVLADAPTCILKAPTVWNFAGRAMGFVALAWLNTSALRAVAFSVGL